MSVDSFLTVALWAFGGTIVLAICALILASTALEIRKRHLLNERRYRRPWE